MMELPHKLEFSADVHDFLFKMMQDTQVNLFNNIVNCGGTSYICCRSRYLLLGEGVPIWVACPFLVCV